MFISGAVRIIPATFKLGFKINSEIIKEAPIP
jgi:hypothetical protein